ncbi:uncharacterized protein LOC129312490 [Prosopis cineraria]|uniref:uncharacterized protein LOC129312490 n=1 Tax=Prosopis cineraria TaxID=364024 RepID=UPI00241026C7|nr:uncharacterized protein LOC129312490 [Prosopis cineraria]XP_054811104.1 uncharacterized protein LOC129312490 [Prosopis cineraria]XP_054811105.1 uncharacterized protein LOC129312490 [Prosopis cineraria]
MSSTSKIFEEEEEEQEEEGGGLRTTRRYRNHEAVSSSLGREHETTIHGSNIQSGAETTDQRTHAASHGDQANSSRDVRGKSVKHHGATKPEIVADAQSSVSPSFAPIMMSPTFTETNQSLNVAEVQEIVDRMKLEGSETSLLAEALKTHPQLCLSSYDRSTQMLCISYRVLLDILNILTTRTPFTITEADESVGR